MSKPNPAQAEPPLFWGQRLPNFADTTSNGSRFELYRDLRRGPIVILSNPTPATLDAAKMTVSKTLPAGTVIALGLESHRNLDNDAVVALPDTNGGIRRALFAGKDAVEAALVADQNQRGVDAFVVGSGLADRLAAALSPLDRPAAVERRETVPVMVLPNLIDPALRDELITAFQDRHEEGTVSVTRKGERADAVVPEIKRRRDLTLEREEPLYNAVRQAIAARLMPELHKTWWVTKLRTEAFYVASYSGDRRDFFAAHRDNTLPHTTDRRIAVSIELNDDYDEGGLVFPEYSDDRWRAPVGGGVAFSCSLMHEAVPVASGTRYVLLVFLAAA